MKTVIELGKLEKENLIKISHVNYMTSDEEKPPVTIGYLIEVKRENLETIPENLKFNPEGEKENKRVFSVFI